MEKAPPNHQISQALRSHLLLDDVKNARPDSDPYVIVARASGKHRETKEFEGNLEEFVGIQAYMVPVAMKGLVEGKYRYNSFAHAGETWFDDDGNYQTAETFEDDNVVFEIVVNERLFSEQKMKYFEPTDRLVKYLDLHRKDADWIDPRNNDKIVKTSGVGPVWGNRGHYLSVRKSELVDYLAARKCGLLFLRHVERLVRTSVRLYGLPTESSATTTKYGESKWTVGPDPLDHREQVYASRLWDSFWLAPASKARRWDAHDGKEFKDGVCFVMEDGEEATYGAGRERYPQIVSLRAPVFGSVLAMAGNRLEFSSLSNVAFRYASGEFLRGCVNRDGQFQTMFGQIAKLEPSTQRQLAGFSEPQKAEPSTEFLQEVLRGEVTRTMPLGWTLSRCLQEVNSPWSERYGETLLRSPEEDKFGMAILIGPRSGNFGELADAMLELQKTVVNEGKICGIKGGLDYSAGFPDDDYKRMRSISFCIQFFKENHREKRAAESSILRVINELRNCKGHEKDVRTVLAKHSIPAESPRQAYLHLMAVFCRFLLVFKELTEAVFQISLGEVEDRVKAPWYQLEGACKYFESGDIPVIS